jgi:hypothetical protein
MMRYDIIPLTLLVNVEAEILRCDVIESKGVGVDHCVIIHSSTSLESFYLLPIA